METLIKFENIGKEFPGVIALENVSFEIKKGEVLGLVGENGAGKSTLVNILAGSFPDYKGKVIFNGQEVRINTPHIAEKLGICTVFQEPTIVLPLDVATNVFLGKEPGLGKFKFILNKRLRIKETQRILDEQVKIKINARALTRDLSISERQVIGILKGLVSKAEIFILDKTSSSLTRSEINNLFRIIRDLKANYKTIVFISHRLDEVFEISDRITVLRDGHHIITKNTKEYTYEDLINSMVGRKIESRYPRTETYSKDVLLEVKNLSKIGEFQEINFNLHKGEVLGLAGVLGAGRTNVVKTIFGDNKSTSGSILVDGKEVRIRGPQEAIKLGIGLLTEDRRNESLIIILDVLRNIIMSKVDKILNYKFVNFRKARKYSLEYVKKLEIKTPSLEQRVEFLSGGNQQKVVLSKWLFADSRILILDEPTKGIDVGAKFEIYKIINQLSENGVGILLISSEIPELLGLCHNIVVMHEGKQMKTLENKNLTQDKILSLALGEIGEN
ncbi:MAG: sugar ABC transporter ATP-binding protein [Actinobacteria bacterium]|nr:sugar ABC transporter ATP-binding protein [Actinomycetota bacterium]